jgi:hypothetical protein
LKLKPEVVSSWDKAAKVEVGVGIGVEVEGMAVGVGMGEIAGGVGKGELKSVGVGGESVEADAVDGAGA